MKKKLEFAGIIVAILIIGIIIWWMIPTHLSSIDAQQAEKILIFDGSRGTELEITDSETMDYLIGQWNQVSVKKERLILFGTGGFSFQITVYLESGKTEEFTINTDDAVIREDILFYERVKGDLCYDYIDTLMENAG